jgi:hypothetical protein
MFRNVLVLVVSLIFVVGCGGGGGDGGGGGGGGEPTEISFSGEQAAFPEFKYDTGWVPADSPIQVQVLATATAGLTAVADAIVGGSSDQPMMSGKAATGLFKLSGKVQFQVLLKVDFSAIQYEGPLDESLDIVFEIVGEAAFDPFLLDGSAVIIQDVPETKLATIPLAGSVPGVDGNVILHIKGTVNSEFSGQCAAVNGTQAHYVGATTTGADLVIIPSVEISIPFLLDETLEGFDVPFTVPPVTLDMDLGDLAVAPGGGVVEGGGTMAVVGTCEGGSTPTDVISQEDATVDPGEDTTVDPGDDTSVDPKDTVGPGKCEDNCNGCCDNGSCMPGNTDEACGVGGTACLACGAENYCGASGCEPIPTEDCGSTCDGCCSENLCLPGTTNGNCGIGGEECIPCPMGFACQAGACEEEAQQECWEFCPGCCMNGSCWSGDKNYACGLNGVECMTCGDGELCIDLVCEVQQIDECWATCDGCCIGESCMLGDENDACGLGGEECFMCPAGSECMPGEGCGVDLSGAFNVVVIDAEVLMNNPDGWDDFGGDPDLFVEVSTYNAAGEVDETGQTSVQDDTLYASYWETVITAVNGYQLYNNGIGVALYDSDTFFDDYISSCSGVVDMSAFVGEPMPFCSSFGDIVVNVIFEPYQ